MNTSSFGVERGTLIRSPATANLMLDSFDRPNALDASGQIISSCWSFSINRNQPLINGYFSRVGTTEVVLEWCQDNISAALGNNTFLWRDSSGVVHTTTIPNAGAYTAKEAIDYLVSALNNNSSPATPAGYSFTLGANPIPGLISILSASPPTRTWSILPSKLANQLDLNTQTTETNIAFSFRVKNPDLRPYRYLDFVCEQLTSVQDVKDAATSRNFKDVLCRWYFADDAPNQLDLYGFPILMGYTPFAQRRIFNPPKQIKWEQNYPVGGYLQFSVYGDDGEIALYVKEQKSDWLMTLQLSEG